MQAQKVETGKAPSLFIRCDGDLSIRGWAEPAVQVVGGNAESDGGGVLRITSDQDLKLMVPMGSTLDIGEVSGDARIKHIEGVIAIGDVHGDLELSDVGQATIKTVNGDAVARSLNGDLSAVEVMGDLSVRDIAGVEVGSVFGDLSVSYAAGTVALKRIMGDGRFKTVSGDLSIASCHGDVSLENVGGIVQLAEVFGDIRLRGGLSAGKHVGRARGDALLLWPLDAPLHIEAVAPKVKNNLPLADVAQEPGHFSGRLGDGETFLILESRGRIILREDAADVPGWQKEPTGEPLAGVNLSGLGEQIEAEITGRLSEISARLERELGPEFSARLERTAQEAANRAEKAAEKALREAEKAMNRVRWQATGQRPAATARAQPAGPAEQNTHAEQLKILQMVEKGLITPQEASELLEAIQG
jgi:hypothetical protein